MFYKKDNAISLNEQISDFRPRIGHYHATNQLLFI